MTEATQSKPATAARYLSVRASSEGISETDGRSTSLFIPRNEIRYIELTAGIGAERPLLQAIAGVAVTVLGVIGLISIYNWIVEGGTLSKVHIALPVNLALGGWLLWGVFRRRVYLLVVTDKDRRKVVFKGDVDHEKLAGFMQEANSMFGYEIHGNL